MSGITDDANAMDDSKHAKRSVIVIGAGAMGSLFGGLLAESGHEVRLIDVEGPHLSALIDHGLRLETDDGDRIIRIPAGTAEAFETPCDLAVIFTKGPATERALRAALHLIAPPTWIVTLQNGLGNVETIRRLIPQARVAFGTTSLPADLRGPGHVASHGSGAVRLWHECPSAPGDIGLVIDALAGAGLDCLPDPSVEVAIWEKVAFNAAMTSVSAITRSDVGQIADSVAGRALVAGACGEALKVASAKGIAVRPDRVRRMIEKAFAEHRDHRPSMLQDMMAGRTTEIENINGAIVAAGREVGCPTPILLTLCDLVRHAEGNAVRVA